MWLREDRKHQVLVKTWSLTNLETKFAVFTFSIALPQGSISSIVKLVLYQKPCRINSIGFCCLRILYVLWLWDSGANLPTFYSTIAEFLFLFLSLFLSLVEREIFAYLSQISLLLLYNRVVLIISFLSYFVSKKKSIHLKEDPIKVRNKQFCLFFSFWKRLNAIFNLRVFLIIKKYPKNFYFIAMHRGKIYFQCFLYFPYTTIQYRVVFILLF